jgi:hypothetical protein
LLYNGWPESISRRNAIFRDTFKAAENDVERSKSDHVDNLSSGDFPDHLDKLLSNISGLANIGACRLGTPGR